MLQASPSSSACPLCVLTLHWAVVDGNNCTCNVVSLSDTIGGCVGVLHCLMFGVSVHDTNSNGFVLLSLHHSS